MSGCLTRLAMICACGVLGYVAIDADPNLPGQVVAGGAAGVGWLEGALSRVTPHATNPAPLPGQDPIVVTTPSATASPTPMPTAPSPATSASVPTPASTPPPSPPPTPSPPATVWTESTVWSAGDLAWVRSTLAADVADDTAAENRFPTQAWYYAGWAAKWTTALQIANALTWPQTQAPPASYFAYVEAWYGDAISLHQEDEQQIPANAWWDNLWIANYQRLDALWARL
jgi:hypothetical protein